jgi:hypothetical protein
MSGKICLPAGSTQATVLSVTTGPADNSSCMETFNDFCVSVGCHWKDGYCNNKQGSLDYDTAQGSFDYCSFVWRYKKTAGEFGTPCSVYADCTVAYKPETRYCCPEYKRLWPYACTGIDSRKFDATVSVFFVFEYALNSQMMLCIPESAKFMICTLKPR